MNLKLSCTARGLSKRIDKEKFCFGTGIARLAALNSHGKVFSDLYEPQALATAMWQLLCCNSITFANREKR